MNLRKFSLSTDIHPSSKHEGVSHYRYFVRRYQNLSALVLSLIMLSCTSSNRPAGDPERLSESQYDIAVDLWSNRRQPREALKYALKAVEWDKDNAKATQLVALLYLNFCQNSRINECKLDEAARFARLSIKASPKNLQAQNTLAVILIQRKKYKEAIVLLKSITEDILYPTPEIAWGNLGLAQLEQGDYPVAISSLRRAVAAQPLFCVGNYRLGLAYYRIGDLAAAVQSFDAALETDAPGCNRLQQALLTRGKVYLELNETELARADFDRCVALDKETPTGRECRAMFKP